ncbi:T3SS effector HopA1 family protein [Actinoplanes philippinensis]|uniref:T3SS effector HopA1 family protein n=1 Tax=Actinoplanes philippinensis TaxID=35752 RepID=UPI003411821E
MTVTTWRIPSALNVALDAVTVAPDRASATVGDRTVESESPRELRRLLAEAIYDVLHAGQRVEKDKLPFRLRDDELESRFAAAMPHRGTTVRARYHGARRTANNGREMVLVERDGVRVWVPGAAVPDTDPGPFVDLTVPAMRPALSPGFFLVDGSTPQPARSEMLRVYVHLTAWEPAAEVFGRVLGALEDGGVPYRAKILSSRLLYPRRDALVVYLDRPWWAAPHRVAEVVRDRPGLGAATSVFTEPLGPGVAVAWEPDDARPAMKGLSFGQHRATALATALLADGGSLEDALSEAFAEAGIDPVRPARNTSSSPFPD